jgi:hypothetical protein
MLDAFISYSHKDSAIVDRLRVHLATLEREKKIAHWYDQKILAGGEIDAEISKHLSGCNLFIAIISPDFLASHYCYEREMQAAIQLYKSGKLRMVSIIAEPCDWQNTPIAQFKVLPHDGKPVVEWPNQNTAYLEIVKELRKITDAIPTQIQTDPQHIAPTPNNVSNRYKVKRAFSEIDKSDYLQKSFKEIRELMKQYVEDIDKVENIQARFSDTSAEGFTCVVSNNARPNSVAYLNVYIRSEMFMGDLSFNYNQRPNFNTINGSFSIEANDYEPYFRHGFAIVSNNSNQKLNEKEVFLYLWRDLIKRANVEFA